MSADEGAWRTVAETAAHFKVSRKKVYAQCKPGAKSRWPHHRTGDHVRAAIRFSPQDWAQIDLLMRADVPAPVVRLAPSEAQIERGLSRLKPRAA